jgi:hypothetical protein
MQLSRLKIFIIIILRLRVKYRINNVWIHIESITWLKFNEKLTSNALDSMTKEQDEIVLSEYD